MCFLLCNSGIKLMRAMRRAQTQKLVEVQCEKGGTRRGDGCGAWAARWLPVPRAGTACWHRAGARPQAIFSAKGKEVKGFKDKSNECKLQQSSVYLILSSLVTLTDCYSPFIKVTLWYFICFNHVFLLGCCLPDGSQMLGHLEIISPDVSGMQCFVLR